MKIILLKDVAHLGNAGEIKNAADGYVRNFLLPMKLAEIATHQKISGLEKKMEAKKNIRKEIGEGGDAEIEKFSGIKLIFEARANEKKHLYNKIGKKEILKKLKEAGSKMIEEKWIDLPEQIKEVGEFGIKIKNPLGNAGVIKLEVKTKLNSRQG